MFREFKVSAGPPSFHFLVLVSLMLLIRLTFTDATWNVCLSQKIGMARTQQYWSPPLPASTHPPV
jgi:hypothetical protein